ncbi:hypothetical protein SAMN06297422_11673 [Lachnospiraceae bacterium]|nr:hypothetical protein SAMN06297422_11673 [Lachnospiraceae bacterium]
MKKKRVYNLKWDKLDNTAQLFPVIAREGMSNVYRVAVTLKEEIDETTLQVALEKVLPHFDVFCMSMKRGIFWFYFEENKNNAPKVKQEYTYPCMFINQYSNNNYLFRLTYYKNRINLEVFHALTDGNGALTFLKEITYQYLRLKHSDVLGSVSNSLGVETSLDTSDSYISNYRKKQKKSYKTKRSVVIKGEKLPINQFAIIHGTMPIDEIKKAAKSYGATINQYLVAVYTWAIYINQLKRKKSEKPLTVCVPVNLRPYFESDTNKNFFVVVTSVFEPVKDDYTFEEVVEIVKSSLSQQITKENLERLFSYNVSNEMNLLLRAIPLFLKNIAMKQVYNASAKANTTTITNLGVMKVASPYEDFIERFEAVLSMSKGQNMKMTVLSFKDKLTLTFSACVRESEIQKIFFRKLSEEGINIEIETNGVYYV